MPPSNAAMAGKATGGAKAVKPALGRRFAVFDLATADEDGEGGPLSIHQAAEKGLYKELVRMVERALDVDLEALDSSGRTPLMWASELGHLETVEALLELGAERTTVDSQRGRTALHLAARAGQAAVVRVLVEELKDPERGDFVNAGDTQGITAVFLALQKGAEGQEAFQCLLKHGAVFDDASSQPPPPAPAPAPEAVRAA